jgi:hypothetical protein
MFAHSNGTIISENANRCFKGAFTLTKTLLPENATRCFRGWLGLYRYVEGATCQSKGKRVDMIAREQVSSNHNWCCFHCLLIQ